MEYSILCREVNRETGEVAVYEIETGTQEELSKLIRPLSFRSRLNPELRYYLCKKEHRVIIISALKSKTKTFIAESLAVKV